MAYEIIDVNDNFIQEMEHYRVPDKTKGLIENSCYNIIVFSEYMLGVRPYSWQVYCMKDIQKQIFNRKEQYEKVGNVGKISVYCRDIDEDKREFIISFDGFEVVVITSRQIGKSTMLGIISIWACTFNHIPATIGYCTNVGIASASDEQAKSLLKDMKSLIILGDVNMATKYLDDKGKPLFGDKFFTNLLDTHQANNTTTITFRNYQESDGPFLLKGSKLGSTIRSYPPTSVVLGKTFSLVIEDEAGMTDRMTDIFHSEYMYPTGNSTHAIRVYTSTPWISSGFFYRMIDPDDIYTYNDSVKTYCFTIDAIKIENPGYYNTIMKKIKEKEANGEYDDVQRAYYCRFIKGVKAYFDSNDVLACNTKSYEQIYSYKNNCDMGIDFGGQVTSKTVITISTLDDNGNIKRIYHKSYEVGKDNNLIEDVELLMKDFKIERIIVDDCPAGQYMIRIMEDEKGWNIQRMNFRADKVKKYGGFRVMLKKHKIFTYDDEALKIEMLSMEFNNGSKQSVIQHAPGYSDDLIDSFVMSCYFYITEEDKDLKYNGNLPSMRRWCGPEFRDIVSIFKNTPQLQFTRKHSRNPEVTEYQIKKFSGYIRHYGKAVSVEDCERRCNFYIKRAPEYTPIWKSRLGKAVHTESDFHRPLRTWKDVHKHATVLTSEDYTSSQFGAMTNYK